MTTVRGLTHGADGFPYEVQLGDGPVKVPAELAAVMPAAGTPVVSGPAGVEVEFDPADPVAVYVWLRGGTEVVRIDGPDLTPMPAPEDTTDEVVY